MNIPRLALPALLVALALAFLPACGGKEEPAKPDTADQPDKPAASDTSAEAAPEKKLWTLNASNLKEYAAAFKDLRENAPRVLEDASENALAMAQANDGLSFGNKATKILETHGLTGEQFKKFGGMLWPAVLAVAPEQASTASGLSALGGETAENLQGAADEALKELTKGVTEEDKTFVKEHMSEILALLE